MVSERAQNPAAQGKVQIEFKNVLVWCYLIVTIIGGLAIIQKDTSLAGGVLRPVLSVVRLICVALALGTQLLFLKKVPVSVAVVVPIIYFVVTTLNSYASHGSGILGLLQFVGFLLLDGESKKRVFDYYKKFLVIMAALGIVAYLANLLSIPIAYKTVEYYNRANGIYYDYGFAYIYSEGVDFRLCGLFNEPGFLGTIIALVLCSDKLNLKKVENWVLLIAGCMTVSVAFVLIIVAYFILMCSKRPKLMALLCVVAVFYFFILPKMTFKDPQIVRFVSRFTFEDGVLAGDNRSNEYVDWVLKKMLGSPYFLWGYGVGYSASVFDGVLTYKTYLIDYGVLGFMLIYGSYFLAALKCSKRNMYAIFFCLCLLLSVYQRPNMFELLYYVVLFGGIEYVLKETDKEMKLQTAV